MNYDLISLGIFYLVLIALFILYKRRFSIQGLIVLYKTKFGLKLMGRLSRTKALEYVGIASLLAGIAGMIFIFVFLARETFKLLLVPGTQPALAPVLPGIEIQGAPALSFWHWIIAILIVACVHEFSHGIMAKRYNIPLLSSGFAFFGPIIGAFVEPDENEIKKLRTRKQLAIFSMGPFMNIIAGLAAIALITAGMGLASFQPDGITVNELLEGYPMQETGLTVPFTIASINGIETNSANDFINATKDLVPGDRVKVGVIGQNMGQPEKIYEITAASNPQNASKAFFGIGKLEQKISSPYQLLNKLLPFVEWIYLLFIWLFIINIGVGLFNLLPLGPLDGGRMFYALALRITKNEAKAKKILSIASMLCILFVLINLLPWINKLIVWLAGLV